MPRLILFAALPFLAGAALAQGAPVAAPGAKPAAQIRYPGVSPSGNAILAKLLQQGDPVLKQIVLQLRDNGQSLQLALQRPTLDVEQLAALLKRGDGLQAQFRSRQTDRAIAAVRALPAADRAPFLKAIGLGAGPAPAPATPQGR